jgi:uncharacterized protein (TIGR00725 family)
LRRIIIGVMGQGDGADGPNRSRAELLGELIAREQWVLLTGGRDAGIMGAANRGAKKVAGSLTVGILPSSKAKPSPDLDVVIHTDMGQARNNINVLSSDVVIACGRLGPGTASEVALALKAGKPVVLLAGTDTEYAFFRGLGPIIRVDTPAEAIASARGQLKKGKNTKSTRSTK